MLQVRTHRVEFILTSSISAGNGSVLFSESLSRGKQMRIIGAISQYEPVQPLLKSSQHKHGTQQAGRKYLATAFCGGEQRLKTIIPAAP